MNPEISQDFVKQLFDYKDGFLVWKVNRGVNKLIGKTAGYFHNYPNGKKHLVRINDIKYITARVIFLWHKGYLPAIVDHKDRDTTNNKIENLREATHIQNMKNRNSAKNSSSKYLGVNSHMGKYWQAQIRVNGKNKNLGHFKNETDAAKAYNEAALLYHREFANLNEI